MAPLVPTSAARRLAPGETVEELFQASYPGGEPGVTVRIDGGDGAFAITSITAMRENRVPYTTEELREFRPESFRRRMEREGKLELITDGVVQSGQPVDVQPGGVLKATVEFSAGAAKGRTSHARLVFEGRTRSEAQLGLVVGSGLATCHVEPNPLRVVLAPGSEITRTVTFTRIPVAATALALIDAPMGGLSVTTINVFRIDRIPFTEEELQEFPPDLRDELRREGHLVSVLIQTAAAGEALRVPEGGSVQVDVRIRAPREAFDVDGVLHLIADRLAPISVRIYPRAQMITVQLESSVIEVAQGGAPAELVADLRLAGGSPLAVQARLGRAGEPWAINTTVQGVPVSTGGAHRIRFQVAVPPDSPVGEHATFLVFEWNEGVGAISVPVTVRIVPGRAAVHAFSPRFAGRQGGEARVGIRIDVQARKQVRLAPVWLPRGVVMLPPSRQWFDPGSHPLDLVFAIDLDRRPVTDGPILVDWDAMDGIHRGQLTLRLSVLLTPQERRFSRPIVTPDGVPLGGQATMVLANDGRGRFTGHMRATGALSFSFRVVAVVRSADGLIGIVGQASGKVFGTDSPGARQFEWDLPVDTGALADHWPSIATAELSVSRAFEFAGMLGTAADAFGKLIDIMAGLAVLAPVPGGAALAVLIVGASEFGELSGIRPLSPGGLPALVTTAGASFVFGPSVILPVLTVGTLASDFVTRSRALSTQERDFARQVFGDTLPFDRIMITNVVGAGGVEFVYPGADGAIMVNLGEGFDAPDTYRRPVKNPSSDPVTRAEQEDVPGQVFIHELVHAWQIAHGAFDAEFLWRGTINKFFRTAPYDYGPPVVPFGDFGLEGQASVVEEWFAGKWSNAPAGFFTPPRQRSDRNDPYFRYIAGNIMLATP